MERVDSESGVWAGRTIGACSFLGGSTLQPTVTHQKSTSLCRGSVHTHLCMRNWVAKMRSVMTGCARPATVETARRGKWVFCVVEMTPLPPLPVPIFHTYVLAHGEEKRHIDSIGLLRLHRADRQLPEEILSIVPLRIYYKIFWKLPLPEYQEESSWGWCGPAVNVDLKAQPGDVFPTKQDGSTRPHTTRHPECVSDRLNCFHTLARHSRAGIPFLNLFFSFN